MKIKLVCIGKTSFNYLNEGIEIYKKRMSHYSPFEYIEVPGIKSTKKKSESTIRKEEGEQILKALDKSDFLVLFDERGKEITSKGFATFFNSKAIGGTRTIVFVIGGAYGFSDSIYDRANTKHSLSKMTFSHQMVRLFAIEQIYRAHTIIKGEPYHHS